MSTRRPRFSVVIPCYNQGAFIHECLESVLSQTLPPHEIIVVNDGSTDPWTLERLVELCKPPVRLVNQENRGLSGARNTGVRESTGDWILPLDADDRLEPDALATYAAAIEQDPSVDIWYPDIHHFGTENDIWHCPEFNGWRQLWTNQMVCSSAIRRTVFDSGIWYNERMRHGYEDWAFYIHACCEGEFKPRALSKPIFLYRRWGYSMLSSADAQGTRLRAQLQEELPIYRDAARLLALKRRWSPFFAVASQGQGIEAALSSQDFQDWRVVDASGRVQRDGDLRLFQENLGRYLLVSYDDEALASALKEDAHLLEKAARTLVSRNPSVLWLDLVDPGTAYPGFLLHPDGQGLRAPARCIGFVLSLKRVFDHPDIPRSSGDLVSDLAHHLERIAPQSSLEMIVGAGGAGFAGFAPPRLAPPKPLPPPESAHPSPPPRLRARLAAILRERLTFLGKSGSQLLGAILGSRGHARLRESRLFRRLRTRVTHEQLAPEPPTAAPPRRDLEKVRAGPLDPEQNRLHRFANRAWFIAEEPPRYPKAAALEGPALLVAVPWIVHGGADRAVLDLVRGLRRVAPSLRTYLVATQPAPMAWADQLVPLIDGAFALGDLNRPDASAFFADLVERLGIGSLLVVNSIPTLQELPALRQMPRRVRVVAQLHSFIPNPTTGELQGHPVVAASRFNNLIDSYTVISRFMAVKMTEKLYVSPSKVRVVHLGIDTARFAEARRPRGQAPPLKVLWLGRLSGEKDPLQIPRIAKAWKARHGAGSLVITVAGGGDPEGIGGDVPSQLHAAVKSANVTDIVRLVGPVPDPVPLYREADCILLTSRYEGIPLVIYEAMAAGLPVITPTRNTSIEEVLSPDDAYFIARQDDPDEYVAALDRLSSDPAEGQARAARMVAASGSYDVARYARDMLEVLFPDPTVLELRRVS